MTKAEKNTTAYQMGYSQEEFDALIDEACNYYFDVIAPAEQLTKKAVFDKICEITKSDPRGIFLVTQTLNDLQWEDELGLYDDDDDECICDECRQALEEAEA